LPLDPLDFEARDWVPHSGWPITRAALEPYYRRAEDVMQLPHVDYGTATWPSRDIPPVKSDAIALQCSQFTHVPNFFDKYGHDLRSWPNVVLLYHANAVALEANDNASSVRQLRVRSLNGTDAVISARHFVICAGAIESARLLLCSRSVEACGIGNRHGVVGRY